MLYFGDVPFDDVVETLIRELPESAEFGQLGDSLADEVCEACGQAVLLEHYCQLVEGAHVAHVRAYLARVDVLKKEPKCVHVDIEWRQVLAVAANRSYFNCTLVWVVIYKTPFVLRFLFEKRENRTISLNFIISLSS